MCMDADTVLDDGFLAAGVQRFTSDRALMAIGGLFYGEAWPRHPRPAPTKRVCPVLPGDPAPARARVRADWHRIDVSSPGAANRRRAAEESLLPGVHGDVYDTAALTEDNELTLAIKSLGGLMASPNDCRVVTELMPTWRNLWTQRLRWQRGALENLGAYGPAPTVLRYWAQQLGIGYSVIALSSFWLLIIVTALATDQWVWFPFWLGVGKPVRPRSGRQRLERRMEGTSARRAADPRASLRRVPRRRLRQGHLRHHLRSERQRGVMLPTPRNPR